MNKILTGLNYLIKLQITTNSAMKRVEQDIKRREGQRR